MIKLLFGIITIIAGFFLMAMLLGAGLLAGLFSRLFGRNTAPRPDAAMLQALATLSDGERALLAGALQRNDRLIADLSNQTALDALIAKNIVTGTQDSTGIMDYAVSETVWNYLRRTQGA